MHSWHVTRSWSRLGRIRAFHTADNFPGGFIAIGGLGLLFIKVVKDLLGNKEDNYYDKNVKK